MLKVYKYQASIDDHFQIILPVGAQILHVEAQLHVPVLWALVNPDEKNMETRHFRLAGTGHPIDEQPETLKHITTFLMAGGGLVWHVFEIIK